MEKTLGKTVPVHALTAEAFRSLHKLCVRLKWKVCFSDTHPQMFEVYVPVKDADLWDFIMEGLV